MSHPLPEHAADRPLGRDLDLLARHLPGRRRTWLILATALLSAGAYFNWQWLVAAGIAPLLLAVAPCLAMCVVGMCMQRDKSCSTPSGARDQKTAALKGER